MKYKVFAVEDEEPIRELYVCALQGADMEARTFSCAADMFDALKSDIPDLFLLDVMLEGMSGFDILSYLKSNAKFKDIPVIMVSAKGDEVSKVKGLNQGADDYVSKPFGVMELIARIKANLRRTLASEQPKKAVFKDIEVDGTTHTIKVNGAQIECPLKIYALIEYLVQNAEKAVKRDDLLLKVWGTDYMGESRTLDMHVAEVRRRLLQNHSAASVVTLRGVGYMLK